MVFMIVEHNVLVRQNSNWKPRSIKGLDGKYVFLRVLGPLADWVAAFVNVGDNFDMIGEAATENALKNWHLSWCCYY